MGVGVLGSILVLSVVSNNTFYATCPRTTKDCFVTFGTNDTWPDNWKRAAIDHDYHKGCYCKMKLDGNETKQSTKSLIPFKIRYYNGNGSMLQTDSWQAVYYDRILYLRVLDVLCITVITIFGIVLLLFVVFLGFRYVRRRD